MTVAWDSLNRAATGTVRTAYGPLIGRWRPARTIGRMFVPAFYPPTRWVPHLAIAPNGDVLLAWTHWNGAYGGEQELDGDAVAWRVPGRPFGAPQVLPNAPGGAIPQFDARGSAYLYGYCGSTVLIAPAHTHRFTRASSLPSAHVLGFSLSLAGAGQGLASWIAGECSFDAAAGNTPGPVYASVLSAGTFGKPLELTPARSDFYYTNVVAVAGGGTVSWSLQSGPPGPVTLSVRIGPAGLPGATEQIAGEAIPVNADGGGDEVIAWPAGWPVYLPHLPHTGAIVRPAGGGADQPAPGYEGEVAVAAPVGRAVASLWNTSPTGFGGTLALSVWRP